MQSHVLPHCSFSCSQGRVDVFFCTGATLLTCRPMNFSGGGGGETSTTACSHIHNHAIWSHAVSDGSSPTHNVHQVCALLSTPSRIPGR